MNMSYCRFQNTFADLKACERALSDDDELSPTEKRYRDKLILLCIKIAEDYKSEIEATT